MDVTVNNAAVCPSCERFIGPAAVCPYCETDADKPPILRRLRLAAFLLAVVGLAFLYVMARQTESTMIRIGDVTPMMNFATVRIAGTVKNKPYVKRNGNESAYLTFYVADGTGDLQVSASREMAQQLVDEKRVPAKGARVEATGTLNVSGDGRVRLRATRLNVAKEDGLPPNA